MAERNPGLELLNGYPGRFMILGRGDNSWSTVLYGITGRSVGSQNRELVVEDDGAVRTVVHDETLETGDPALTLYNAFRFVRRGSEKFLVVSNGKQTDDIAEHIKNGGSELLDPLKKWSYEPDSLKTPRIAGLVSLDANKFPYSLAIARFKAGNPDDTEYRGWQFNDNMIDTDYGELLATYDGSVDQPKPFELQTSIKVPLVDAPKDTLDIYWYMMHPDRRVALMLFSINAKARLYRQLIRDRWGNNIDSFSAFYS